MNEGPASDKVTVLCPEKLAALPSAASERKGEFIYRGQRNPAWKYSRNGIVRSKG